MVSLKAWSARLQKVLLAFSILSAVICLGLGIAQTASARTAFNVYGANGDAGATDECPAGKYFVGVVGNVGAWIDQITVVCAERKPDGSIGGGTSLPSRGGGGGGFAQAQCGKDEVIVSIKAARTAGYQIRSVDLTCKNVRTDSTHLLSFGGTAQVEGNPSFMACGAGNAATGMVIRYGKHVNGLGLICNDIASPAPSSNRAVEPGVNRPGSDYRNFDVGNADLRDRPELLCQTACQNEGQCKAWTYVKPGIQGPKARCWLKSAIPDAGRDDCCISGVSRPDKAIKNVAHGGSLESQVLAYAISHLGKCVDSKGIVRDPCPPLGMGQVGEGECTHLVQAALASVGAKFTSNSYLWGTPIGSVSAGGSPKPGDYQPGDVIQLVNAKLSGPNGWWETKSQHSAIIESVVGGVLNVIQQNTWVDGKNLRFLTRGTINLNWNLEHGNYIVYRPTK